MAGSLRGRQARLLASYLVVNRERTVGRGELIAMLWPERGPKDPQADLRSILSGLRRALGPEVLVGGGQLGLALPEPVWVDTEVALAAVRAARAAAREGDWRSVHDEAQAVIDLLEPGFLLGEEAEWVEARRREIEDTGLEALEWVARSALALGGTELVAAERAARELVSRLPYRETGYRSLMEAYAAEGNAAEALRVYDQLRTLLRDELGTAPAPELQELHERLLRGERVPGGGRSRLCQEPAERCPAKGAPVCHVAGLASGKAVPLMSVLQFLRTHFEITDRDSDETARERTAASLASLVGPFEDELSLLFDFPPVPDPEQPVDRMYPEGDSGA